MPLVAPPRPPGPPPRFRRRRCGVRGRRAALRAAAAGGVGPAIRQSPAPPQLRGGRAGWVLRRSCFPTFRTAGRQTRLQWGPWSLELDLTAPGAGATGLGHNRRPGAWGRLHPGLRHARPLEAKGIKNLVLPLTYILGKSLHVSVWVPFFVEWEFACLVLTPCPSPFQALRTNSFSSTAP